MSHKVTVYEHKNGQLVIWGRSEHFESSELVKTEYVFDEEVTNSKSFRKIVGEYNHKNELLRVQEELIKTMQEQIDTLVEIKKLTFDGFYMYLRDIPFWKRLWRKNLIKIVDEIKQLGNSSDA